MQRVAFLASNDGLSANVLACLERRGDLSVVSNAATRAGEAAYDTVVHLPKAASEIELGPDLALAAHALSAWKNTGARHLIVVSSAEAYGASPHNPGFIAESRPPAKDGRSAISEAWLAYEALAREVTREGSMALTILRTCPVLARDHDDYWSKLLSSGVAVTLAGHDPSVQLLAPEDLAGAIACAVTRSQGGVFNVAPDGVIPLRAALESAHRTRVPVLRELQSPARRFLSPLGLAAPIERLDYIRYSWTVSNHKIKRELGFAPAHSTAGALQEFVGDLPAANGTPVFDDFGMDKEYIATAGRTLFDFLSRRYWRIEVEGLEHVPRTGKGILAGIHRGLVAWDGVMILHLLAQRIQRFPRFLVHPTGFRFPFVFDFTTKLGGISACQENADYVLERDELLGIFPEGIRGVFSLYREAYQIRKFGRHDFVKMAIRHGAPIVPFVIVGSAETYPIVGKIDWSWWKRKTEWPFFPITPTLFPLFPAPLPSKWRVRFLPAIEVGSKHPPEAAKDAKLVRTISDDIKRAMEQAFEQMTGERKSIFFG